MQTKEKSQKVVIPIYRRYPEGIVAIKVYRNCIDWVNMAIRDYWLKDRIKEIDSDVEAEDLFINRLKGLDKQYDTGLEILQQFVGVDVFDMIAEVEIDGCEVIPFDFSADQFVGTPNPIFA